VDVIGFNRERHMPAAFYEVEHSTDIKNSLSKFYELQDFNARFCIVADKSRRNEFDDKLSASIFRAHPAARHLQELRRRGRLPPAHHRRERNRVVAPAAA